MSGFRYSTGICKYSDTEFAVAPKKTIDRDLEFLAHEMLQCEHFPWINVPLCLEIGKGPNWYDQDKVSTLYSDDFGLLNREECGF